MVILLYANTAQTLQQINSVRPVMVESATQYIQIHKAIISELVEYL